MNAELEATLIECLSALDQREPLDAILARYPAQAAELRPMLEVAAGLPAFRLEPSEAQKVKARRAFLAQAAQLRTAPQRRAGFFLPRLATMLGALILVVGVLGGGAVVASGSALPGDPLYGLKRAVESARLTVSGNSQTLAAQFEQTRLAEINALLDAGREALVEFSGDIESIQADAWIIRGLVVQVDAATQLDGTPETDRLADVRARTSRQGLYATAIVIHNPIAPVPSPTPEPIAPDPLPTRTPSDAPTRPTPEPTEPRPELPPLPTWTPTPAPVAPPTEIEFTGTVNRMDNGVWIIDGATISVDGNTEIRGNIGVGQRVKVNALRYGNDRIVARSIERLTDGGDDNSNEPPADNENDNQNDSNDNQDDDNRNDNQNDNDDDNENDNQNDNDDDNDNDNQNDDS